MIAFSGFPFLDTKEEPTFHVPVSTTMTPVSSLFLLPSAGLSLGELDALLENAYQGFPVVDSLKSKMLLGYIGRTELRYAIDKARREQQLSPDCLALFSPPDSIITNTPSTATPVVFFDDTDGASGSQTVEFSHFVDPTPLTVHPRLPLETVMEIFKKMGPRVVLVELKGRVTGLVTVKDCLKYQHNIETRERGGTMGTGDALDRWLLERARIVGSWLGRCTRGRIRLGMGEAANGDGDGLLVGRSRDPRDARMEIGGDELGILEGTENDDGVELSGF